MKRLVVIVATLVITLAGPAQVWCQVTCAAPSHGQAVGKMLPHCPSHNQAPGPTLASGHDDQCRAPESSRSANPVRTFVLGSGAAVLAQVWNAPDVQALSVSWAPPVAAVQPSGFNYKTPLRI